MLVAVDTADTLTRANTVMDNGSTHGSALRAERVPGVTVRMLGRNLGFAVANNRAIGECHTDLVVLLSPPGYQDAIVCVRSTQVRVCVNTKHIEQC